MYHHVPGGKDELVAAALDQVAVNAGALLDRAAAAFRTWQFRLARSLAGGGLAPEAAGL